MNFIETFQTNTKENSKLELFSLLNNKAMSALTEMQESTIVSEGVKKAGEYSMGRHKATTHKDSDTGEYTVKFHTDNKHLPNVDYFTDDKSDASGTAKTQVDKLHSKDVE